MWGSHFSGLYEASLRNAGVHAGEHLGFGLGAHSCAGQGLARMEAHAILRAVVDQVESLELSGPPTLALNNIINAWATLPLTVRPTPG